MTDNAFTAGVKPGGLNSASEIRILLCYLMRVAPKPLSQSEMESALIGEELVNYFEFADSLSALCKQGLAVEKDGRYTLTENGVTVAKELADDVPLSVRETAVRAAVLAQQFAQKEAEHKTVITPLANGHSVRCSIEDLGIEIFSCSLFMPDAQTAALVKQHFIENGDEVFKIMLASLTGNHELIQDVLSDFK
ncbi:MAG: DUF4364 family protein [Ruthenibacterium sp.]